MTTQDLRDQLVKELVDSWYLATGASPEHQEAAEQMVDRLVQSAEHDGWRAATALGVDRQLMGRPIED